MKYSFKKPLTGLEIDDSSLKMVQVIREKKGWRLIRCKKISLPDETMELSHKDENILDPYHFQHAVEEALADMTGKVTRVGISLPNESLKITTHSLENLHNKKSRIKELIAWKEKTTLPFPVEKAKISFSSFYPKSMEGKVFYLVAIGFEDIIKDFEVNMQRLKINAEVIRPSVINHINFYTSALDNSGIKAFLGLFEHYFSFFVFEDSQMIFYRGKRRSASYFHFVQEIDMTIELFQREYPDKMIETLCLGSQIELTHDLESELEGYSDMDMVLINEKNIITPDQNLDNGEALNIGTYTSAIGAAQSLID